MYWEEVRVGRERRDAVQPANREERRIEAIANGSVDGKRRLGRQLRGQERRTRSSATVETVMYLPVAPRRMRARETELSKTDSYLTIGCSIKPRWTPKTGH